MRNGLIPTFEEWVAYCFTQGYADFNARSDSPDYDAALARSDRFAAIPVDVLGGYLIRLLHAPAFIADQYTDDQIGDGTWYLFGVGSSYFSEVFARGRLPQDVQIKCMSEVATIYLELYDHVCCKRGKDPEGEFINSLNVDVAVYMIWDMDSIEGAVMRVRGTPHLVEPGLHVLETILCGCRTSSCLASALHGLGHIHGVHPRRTEQIIDAFLADRMIPDWLRLYALWARKGSVL